jgi:hypothetical protein
MKPAISMEVKNSDRLVRALKRGIAEFQPRIVVETGTYLGHGSMQAILSAFGLKFARRAGISLPIRSCSASGD